MHKHYPYNANMNWATEIYGEATHELAQIAVLMDIRSELMKLNQLLHGQNFTSIPSKLDKIAKNTTKPRRKKR